MWLKLGRERFLVGKEEFFLLACILVRELLIKLLLVKVSDYKVAVTEGQLLLFEDIVQDVLSSGLSKTVRLCEHTLRLLDFKTRTGCMRLTDATINCL
jgi:hypothetical protein